MSDLERGLEYIHSPAKRQLDICGAISLGALMAPAGLMAAIGSAIDSRSLNPIFTQSRIGLNGNRFDLYKLRSLGETAENDPKVEFGTYDPRASKIGIFIRKFGLDEIPQVYNILRGDMSMVGPRPMTTAGLDRYQEADPRLFDEWYENYQAVKPGLTSSSSIYRKGAIEQSDDVITNSMILDIYDIENATLAGDLGLIAATPLMVLRSNLSAANIT